MLQEKILQDEHIHVGILEFVQDVPFTVDAGAHEAQVFLQSRLGRGPSVPLASSIWRSCSSAALPSLRTTGFGLPKSAIGVSFAC